MNPLNSIVGTIIGGVVLAIILVLVTMGDHIVGAIPVNSIMIWLHVLAGITWIGLLYYFNFVQIPALADAAGDDGGPGGAGITKYVAPRALSWFRWSSLVTWLSGAAFPLHRGQYGRCVRARHVDGHPEPLRNHNWHWSVAGYDYAF